MRLVRKLLKHAGYTVLEAEDGLTGLQVTEDERPDLILMDINLPDIDGVEVTQRIKAQDELSQIPIIALTANAMHGDEQHYLDAGMDGYIAKPVNKALLLDEIAKFLPETETN